MERYNPCSAPQRGGNPGDFYLYQCQRNRRRPNGEQRAPFSVRHQLLVFRGDVDGSANAGQHRRPDDNRNPAGRNRVPAFWAHPAVAKNIALAFTKSIFESVDRHRADYAAVLWTDGLRRTLHAAHRHHHANRTVLSHGDRNGGEPSRPDGIHPDITDCASASFGK